jgi:hypothetical protein
MCHSYQFLLDDRRLSTDTLVNLLVDKCGHKLTSKSGDSHINTLTADVTPEAIEGAWKLNSGGVIAGDFEASPNYRKIEQSKRILPSYMQVNRLHNAGMWISEIDPRFESFFPNIPPEAIVGYWLIDSNGNVTDQFRPTSKYAPNKIDAMLKDLVKRP